MAGINKRITRTHFILLTLYSIVFLNSFGYFLIMPELADMISNSGHSIISKNLMQDWGDYLFSLVLGLGSLSSLIFAPVLGRLSDYIGRRKVLIFCTLLTMLSFVLPILALVKQSFALFMLGNFINGIASNNQPISQAVISDLTMQGQRRAWRFSIDTFVVTLAMTLGPIAYTFLSDQHLFNGFSHTTPFTIANLLTLLSLILLIILLPETNTHLKPTNAFSLKNTWQSFTDVFSLNAATKRLLCVFFFVQLAWAQYFQYSYLYLTETLKFSERAMSLFNASIGIWISISLVIIYPIWLKKLTLRMGIILAIFMSTIGMLALAYDTTPTQQWLLIIPLSFGIGLYFPSCLTLFSTINQQQQGWIMAIANALIGLAWLCAGFTSVYLSHISVQLPIESAALLLAIGIMIMCYDTLKQNQLMTTKNYDPQHDDGVN